MRSSFLNYAMSVIVARALPDVRDGLKPVHRRIIYAMNDLGMQSDKAHKKSARIAGEVMGKYHPHGESSIYDALVRMAQTFSYRYPLIDGHGNFGSIDGDPAAAMRYTEARMSKICMEIIRDLGKNTVDFVDNYDATETEPTVLPAKFPNLLVNGTTGIAVGMATNIPPHNLTEVINGIIAVMNNAEITIDELMEHIKGPDFPTAGQLLGLTGLRNAYHTGNGIVIMRATAEIVEKNNRNAIIVTEIPYQVNKSKLLERIAEVVKEKIVDGITGLQDESNRKGMRIVIDLRRDVNPHVMLNNLYKYTQLQQSFGINMIALVNSEPKTLNLKQILVHYIDHQYEVLTRRTIYDLEKAEARSHILQGLIIGLENIDEVVELIKKSANNDIAMEGLMSRFGLTEIQAKAILDMRLGRLTALEIDKIIEEDREIRLNIEELRSILADDQKKATIIQKELLEVKDRFGDDRRTAINLHEDINIDNEDLIPTEDVIITITNNGYAKRMKVENYKAQNRGGTGMSGIKTNENDYVLHSLMTSTHDYLLFFTTKGRVYKIKGYNIPEASRTAKGIPIVNIIQFEEGEGLAAFTNIKDFASEETYLFFTTKNGVVKRCAVDNFKNIRTNGIIAIGLRDNDELLSVKVTNGKKNILLGASNGKAIRFDENDVRDMGRNASGVRGMDIGENDYLVGMTMIDSDEEEILVVTEKGFGKRSLAEEYRLQYRGGRGIKALNVTEKNGSLVALRSVNDQEDLIISTNKGVVIRMHVEQIAKTGRATQGVRLIRLKDDQSVSTITVVTRDESEEIEESEIAE
ncbi:MAG: DNA gyrase subunit A [Erysipelotrichales bacterium]|nr:DNA gyrase subunit A [Erysipelotrichales bacterium]